MGNQTIFAVKHDDIESLKNIDFRTVVSMQNHAHEIIDIKTPTGMLLRDQNQDKQDLESFPGGIMVSGYFHASDGVSLYVDDSKMLYFPIFDFHYLKKEKPEQNKVINSFVRNYRDYFSKASIRKDKKMATPINKKVSKITIFGFLNDRLHDITQEDFQKALELAKDMPTFSKDNHVIASEYQHSIFGHLFDSGLAHIVPICTIDSDSFAMVRMSGNTFEANIFDRHETYNDYSHPMGVETKEIDINCRRYRPKEEVEAYINSARREIIESMGYGFTPKDK